MQLRPHQEQAVKAMLRNNKGQIIVPTGGGKTMCMIDDAMNEFSRSYVNKTIVVVAPRILLANQLSSEFLESLSLMLMWHTFTVERHIILVQLKLMNLKSGITTVPRTY